MVRKNVKLIAKITWGSRELRDLVQFPWPEYYSVLYSLIPKIDVLIWIPELLDECFDLKDDPLIWIVD